MDSQMINFSIPKPMLKRLDTLAKYDMSTRSEVIRDSLRAYLQQRQSWDNLAAYGRRQAQKFGIKNEDDVERVIDEVRAGK